MKINNCIISFLIILLITGADLMAVNDNSNIVQFGRKEGLPSVTVDYIEEDSEGYIYFCTSKGFSIFDGNTFTNYDAQNTAGFSNNLTCLVELDKHHLLIGSRDNGLYLFNKFDETIRHVNLGKVDLQNIMYLLKDSFGTVWITCTDGSLFYIDNYQKLLNSHENVIINRIADSFNIINSIIEFKGQILIANGSNVVYSIKRSENTLMIHPIQSFPPEYSISAFCLFSPDEIGMFSNKGIQLFNSKDDKIALKSIIQTGVSSAKSFFKYNNTLYILSEGHIYEQSLLENKNKKAANRIDGELLTKQHFIKHSLSLKIDTHGRLWSGTWFDGVFKYTLASPVFTYYKYKSVQTHALSDVVWSVCFFPDSKNMYVGSLSSGLCKSTDLTGYTECDDSNYSPVWCLFGDKQASRIYVGTWGEGLSFVDKRTGLYRRSNLNELKGLRIFFISRKGPHELFIGTGEKGLFIYDEATDKVRAVKFPKLNIQNMNVRYVMEDKVHGGYWMATYDEGLIYFKFDSMQQVCNVRHYPSVNGEKMQITSLYKDGARVWLTLTNGLAYFDLMNPSMKIIRIPELEGMLVNQIVSTRKNEFWIASHNGLLLYDNKSNYLTSFLTNQIHYRLEYDKATDQIYSCTSNGLVRFDPDVLRNISANDKILIRNLEVDGKTVTPHDQNSSLQLSKSITYTDTLIFPPSTKNISLQLSVLSSSQLSGFTLFYKLNGFDNYWNRADQNNQTARYSNLPPGKYQLDIRLMNTDNTVGAKRLYIIKQEYWWKTGLAKSVYLFFLLGIILYLILFFRLRYKKRYVHQLEITERENQEEIYRQRIRFFTNISHDIKTPLTLLLSPLNDMINHPGMPEVFKERLQSMYANGDILMKKINKILRFRNSEAVDNEIQMSACCLQQMMYEIVMPFKEYAQRQGLYFSYEEELEISDPILIQTDRERIESILENLISNAIKYTQEKGQISVCYYIKDTWLCMEVTDTGQGISAENLAHIFDRYYRINSDEKGTGIGLYLVKRYVEQLSGEIFVTSNLENGTTFRIQLPMQLVEKTEEEKVLRQGNMMQVLIVDDNKEIRDYLFQLFSPYYEVVQASNGIEGVDAVQKMLPDIILSDLMMSGMDGISFCKQIKGQMLTSHIPFIFLSAKNDLETRMACWQAGADLFEEKPFKSQLLLTKVSNLLKSRRLLKYKYQIANPIQQQTDNVSESDNSEEKQLNLDDRFLQEVNAAIEKHKENPELSIQELVAELKMRHDQLYRKLKALTGLSANQYIRTYRLNCAAAMLRSKKYMVTEVLYSVGFNNPSYFTKCFKKEFGMLPSEYLDTIEGKNSME